MDQVLEISPSGGAPDRGASYPVRCGADVGAGLGAVWEPAWRQAAVIGDDTTIELFADVVEAPLLAMGVDLVRVSFPPGERYKTRETKAAVEDALFEAGLDRSAVIVAVGGGVVLDLAGFVAATYMRGIAHVAVATTLLAQVDAAIGGKTGVDTPFGKNLVGAFHHPRAVLLHTGALRSLPLVERRNGLAEVVKHAVLRDEKLFATLERWASRAGPAAPEPAILADGASGRRAGRGGAPEEDALLLPDDLIVRCAAIKAAVVAEDDRDQGVRHILNFGHTVGHAIEAATGHRVPHGQAVAAGMVIEARVAASQFSFPHADVTRLMALLTRIGLPTHPPCSFAVAAPFLRHDKKSLDGTVRCALPQQIGITEPVEGSWLRAVDRDAIERAWGAPG